MISPNLEILLVEDDDVDAEAVRRGFVKANISGNIRRVCNGVQALEFLESPNGPPRHGSYIILLDLKMPRMNGIEFLRSLRRNERLKKSVVFVLTTSNDERDRGEAYSEGIAGYVHQIQSGHRFPRTDRHVGSIFPGQRISCV